MGTNRLPRALIKGVIGHSILQRRARVLGTRFVQFPVSELMENLIQNHHLSFPPLPTSESLEKGEQGHSVKFK